MGRPSIAAAAAVALAACSSPEAPSGPVAPSGNPGGLIVRRYLGTFHPVAHGGMGLVQLEVAADSSRTLRFGNMFATSPGPLLEVWLVAAADARDNQTVLDSMHVSLGMLQSPVGPQSYAVPSSVDLTRYRAVTVWCVDARVNFTTAPLQVQ